MLLGSDACYAPVLTMSEATNDAHIQARQTIIERDGVPQPAPAPRFSRTAGEVQRSAPWPGQHTDEALGDWGVGDGRDREATGDRRRRIARAPARGAASSSLGVGRGHGDVADLAAGARRPCRSRAGARRGIAQDGVAVGHRRRCS